MPCISGFTMATNNVQTPTVRGILGLKLKQLWSEIDEQNMRTECQIGAVRIDGKSSLYRQCYNAYCAAFTLLFSFKLGYFLGNALYCCFLSHVYSRCTMAARDREIFLIVFISIIAFRNNIRFLPVTATYTECACHSLYGITSVSSQWNFRQKSRLFMANGANETEFSYMSIGHLNMCIQQYVILLDITALPFDHTLFPILHTHTHTHTLSQLKHTTCT